MVIHFDKKYIFIEIPKTGTNSIRGALIKDGANSYKDNGLRHCSLEYGLSKSKNIDGTSFFKFCFMRNPWDLFVSFYFFSKKENRIKKDMTFKEYIKADSGLYELKLHKYSNFSNFDFIGKFENLQADFEVLCDKIKIPQEQLPCKNKTEHKHYTEYYDDATREIIAKRYSQEIEYFGYKFG